MTAATRKRLLVGVIAGLLACLPLGVEAQSAVPSPAPLRFDVVVIKPSAPESHDAGMSLRDGTLRTHALLLRSIITSAYGVREDLISGLPSWVDTARYDITAKVLDTDAAAFNTMNRTERRAMIVALLFERFGFKAHMQTKTLPVYELVLARGGPKFAEHTPAAPQSAGAAPAQGKVTAGRGEFAGTDAKLFLLTSYLAETLEKTIVDHTGLNGRYDYRLTFTPDDATPADDHAPPSLFTALEEELGLKLNAGKGPVETLVVDHIERPSEN